MLRFLLAVLAVLVAGLAVLFERPWLYMATGAILAAGLGLLGWWIWTAYLKNEDTRASSDSSDIALDEVGIVDIHPAEMPQDDDASSSGPPPPSPKPASPSSRPASGTPASGTPASGTPASGTPTSETPASPSQARSIPDDSAARKYERPVLGPLLEALRAAVDARTVALLAQEHVALTYRIEALASTHTDIRQQGTFDTQTPLVTATMSREDVTLRSLAHSQIAVEDLGYYTAPPTVDHLAVAPLPQPDSSTTTFLLVDTTASADLGTSRARTLLKRFTETVALLYDLDRTPPAPSDASRASEASVADQSSAADEASVAEQSGTPPADASAGSTDNDTENETASHAPRPRRELIAEEMHAVEATDTPLALALVHLNRAESIARRGEEAVSSTERLFEARLDQMAPTQRIERFGELTYGVFFHEAPEGVESWVADLEAAMAREQGELEGGVSVGVAVWSEETPEALRSAATTALRKAYETGTSTIVM
jgi:hypothetical protein